MSLLWSSNCLLIIFYAINVVLDYKIIYTVLIIEVSCTGLLKPALWIDSAVKLQDCGFATRSHALHPKGRIPDIHCLGSGWIVKKNISSVEGIKSCLSSCPSGNLSTELFWRVFKIHYSVFILSNLIPLTWRRVYVQRSSLQSGNGIHQ